MREHGVSVLADAPTDIWLLANVAPGVRCSRAPRSNREVFDLDSNREIFDLASNLLSGCLTGL